MTSRVKALSGANAPHLGMGGPKVVPVQVTPSMADRAADDVLRDIDPDMAQQIRGMWAKDPDIEVAQMLRMGATALADRARFPVHARIQRNVPYVLTESEMRALIEWFPEFDLSFNVSAGHDHGVGAAVRHLDTMAMHAEIPPGMDFADFGGNELTYVKAGNTNAIVVRIVLDHKDPAREQRKGMELRMIVRANAGAAVGSREYNTHHMAQSILFGEDKYLVNERLETFNRPVKVGIMSHVYDVPISAIPLMMERTGMKMLMMTLHFSNRFFDTDSGELKELGARYRIDRKNDVFEFGFVGSGARWYTHKWSEFQRYGVDQILQGRSRRYSMKIIRRRGDTLTYRVLEIGGGAITNHDQYYRVPDVPCVRVTADLGRDHQGYGRRIDEVFPEDVWNRMVREAAVDLTRGIVDYHKCVGNYSQITAGHTYNGQDAVLGTVPVDKIPLLVALSSTSAAALVARMRAGIRYGIDLELDQRMLEDANFLKLSFGTFYAALAAAVTTPLSPVVSAFKFMVELSGDALLKRLVEVEPVQQVRRVPADVYQDVVRKRVGLPREDFPAREYLLETQDMQEFLARMVEEVRNPADVDVQEPTVEGEAVGSRGSATSESATYVESQGSRAPRTNAPSWMPLGDKMEYFPGESPHGPEQRYACIEEEIEIIRQEASNLEAWMATQWLRIMATGRPDRDLLASKRDEWGDLDLWHVNENVLAYSVLGRPIETFDFGGVYCPEPMRFDYADGTHVMTTLRQVDEHTWSSQDGRVQRVHKVINGPLYTGWVIVNKSTRVHNGPMIIAGLQRALKMPMNYELGVYKGGPGCGKTYMIEKRWVEGQQVMSPLVLSIHDIRAKLVKNKGLPILGAQKVARTIDSWLCYAASGRPLPRCSEILSDEVYNGRAARAYAAWALMRPSRVVAFGDDRQIPPVDPSGTVRLYKDVAPKHVVMCYLIYRYGPEVLAMINHHYDNKLRTVKPIGSTKVSWVKRPTDFKPVHSDLAILAMYQAQKVTARKYFPDHRDAISTTHEAQGASVKEVFVCEFDGRVRPKNDPFDLYQDPNYVNVALSRVEEHLVGCSLAPTPNLLVKWFEYANDPRRVKACADVSTAGQSIEFA